MPGLRNCLRCASTSAADGPVYFCGVWFVGGNIGLLINWFLRPPVCGVARPSVKARSSIRCCLRLRTRGDGGGSGLPSDQVGRERNRESDEPRVAEQAHEQRRNVSWVEPFHLHEETRQARRGSEE